MQLMSYEPKRMNGPEGKAGVEQADVLGPGTWDREEQISFLEDD